MMKRKMKYRIRDNDFKKKSGRKAGDRGKKKEMRGEEEIKERVAQRRKVNRE